MKTASEWKFLKEATEKTEQEIAAALERRKESGKRLQELQAKKRAEKVCRFRHFSMSYFVSNI